MNRGEAGRMFKRALQKGDPMAGLFCCSYSVQVVEALAGSAFDFLIFDGEHTPNALPQLHAQLCALGAGPTAAVVRIPGADPALIKLLLDLGVAALMLPNVHSAQDAAQAVRMMRYPPNGTRGLAGTVRATDYGRHVGYFGEAAGAISLIVQVESLAGVDSIDQIAAVEGVDAVFIGPHDLAADMGHIGQSRHADVTATVLKCLARIREAGKAAGVLCSDADAETYQKAGACVLALGSDLGLLVNSADALALRHRGRRLDSI